LKQKTFKSNNNLYDTSDFPKEHPLYSDANKKVFAKMKDKCNGIPIAECVCLRPKMYSILKGDEKNRKKAKAAKKCVVKKQIMHEQYKETVFGKKQLWHGMNILRSQKHEIYGMYVNKISLSPFDSKRWIAEDYGYNLPFKFTDAEIAEFAAAEEAL